MKNINSCFGTLLASVWLCAFFLTPVLFASPSDYLGERPPILLDEINTATLIVEGTITSIQAPLIKLTCRANCLPVPAFTFEIGEIVWGATSEETLTFDKSVFNWPQDLVAYNEGERCVLLLQKTAGNDWALLSVLPGGKVTWTLASTRNNLKYQVRNNLIAQLSSTENSRKLAEIIHLLPSLVDSSDADKVFHPFVISLDKRIRYAAVGALVCNDPSPRNIDLAKKEIGPAIEENNREFFLAGTLNLKGSEQRTYQLKYYDCLSGPIPPEKPLADLWHWIDVHDRQK